MVEKVVKNPGSHDSKGIEKIGLLLRIFKFHISYIESQVN